jgi:hypothetical protein
MSGLTIKAGDRLQVTPGLRYEGYFEQGTQAGARGARAFRFAIAWLPRPG